MSHYRQHRTAAITSPAHYTSYHQVRSRFKQGFNEVRKRSQSAGPGKFDKKIGKEDSFDQVELGAQI